MKWIRWVLLKLQSGHDSVHRWPDEWTDGHGETSIPPFQLRWSRGIMTKINLKITCLNFHSNLPGANVLKWVFAHMVWRRPLQPISAYRIADSQCRAGKYCPPSSIQWGIKPIPMANMLMKTGSIPCIDRSSQPPIWYSQSIYHRGSFSKEGGIWQGPVLCPLSKQILARSITKTWFITHGSFWLWAQPTRDSYWNYLSIPKISMVAHWLFEAETTFSNAFLWMKMYWFRLRFHWSLFLRIQLTTFQHWFV